MNLDKMKEWLIDYLDGLLTEAQRQEVERNIREDTAWRREYEQLRAIMLLMQESPGLVPDAQLKHDFDRLLQEEIRFQQARPIPQPGIFRQYGRYAAAIALLLIGLLAGWIISRQSFAPEALQVQQNEREVAKQQVMASLHHPTSASQRLSGILASQAITVPDQEILEVLIQVLNQDDNTNVRLAALQALLPYREEPKVYDALLESLVSQEDPVVQISLINLMVEFRDEQVEERLQKIIRDETVPDMVKEEAYVGLFRFS